MVIQHHLGINLNNLDVDTNRNAHNKSANNKQDEKQEESWRTQSFMPI